MLKQLHDKLWIADMKASLAGFEFDARMTVIRLADEKLWIHSPIELTPELQIELDNLGEIGYVLSPFERHYQHLQDFADVYPDAKYYAPPGLDTKSLPGVHFTARLKDGAPEPEWKEEIEQLYVRGDSMVNEVVFFHSESRTLILTDLCFNIPSDRPPMTRAIGTALGIYENFAPSLSFKLLVNDKAALQSTLHRILQWDFDRVIIAHGDILETGGKEQMRKAFSWLW
jgi:hypothetical protein